MLFLVYSVFTSPAPVINNQTINTVSDNNISFNETVNTELNVTEDYAEVCGNLICNHTAGENCGNCQTDCSCSQGYYCSGEYCVLICNNDGYCSRPLENEQNCINDCGCTNGVLANHTCVDLNTLEWKECINRTWTTKTRECTGQGTYSIKLNSSVPQGWTELIDYQSWKKYVKQDKMIEIRITNSIPSDLVGREMSMIALRNKLELMFDQVLSNDETINVSKIEYPLAHIYDSGLDESSKQAIKVLTPCMNAECNNKQATYVELRWAWEGSGLPANEDEILQIISLILIE